MPTFLDIGSPNAPQHAMFTEDENTGLPVKQTKKQKLATQTSSPTKRKAKETGKRTGGRPAQKLQTTRGMSLRTDDVLEKKTANTEPGKTESSHSDDSRSTTSSEDVAPSPKRQNQKNAHHPQHWHPKENRQETASRRPPNHSEMPCQKTR